MNGHEGSNETRMAKLLEALDPTNPALYPISSCGGHDDPGEGQVQWPGWEVNFTLTADLNGWAMLFMLTDAIMDFNLCCCHENDREHYTNYVALHPWCNGNTVSFELRGYIVDGIAPDPDHLAEHIHGRLEKPAKVMRRGHFMVVEDIRKPHTDRRTRKAQPRRSRGAKK